MPDAVDIAVEIEAEHLARGLARAAAPIAPGVSGECDQCEWWMPRLVDGLCAFCRDGRQRPDDWEPPQRPSVSITNKGEESVMAASKSITFVAAGAVLAEIQKRTAQGVSNNRAALDLVEAGIRAESAPAVGETITLAIDALPAIDLLNELRNRIAKSADPEALQRAHERTFAAEKDAEAAEAAVRDWQERAATAEARALAAEQQLATIRVLFA